MRVMLGRVWVMLGRVWVSVGDAGITHTNTHKLQQKNSHSLDG